MAKRFVVRLKTANDTVYLTKTLGSYTTVGWEWRLDHAHLYKQKSHAICTIKNQGIRSLIDLANHLMGMNHGSMHINSVNDAVIDVVEVETFVKIKE